MNAKHYRNRQSGFPDSKTSKKQFSITKLANFWDSFLFVIFSLLFSFKIKFLFYFSLVISRVLNSLMTNIANQKRKEFLLKKLSFICSN
jgi:hypothetical protein